LQTSGNDLQGRRVLVVEDESMVAMLLEDNLADIGCEVVDVAFRLNEALDKANSASFDIAILDVNLNGDYTFPVAAALRQRGMPFVFATGYDASSLPGAFRGTPVLRKPFQRRDLEQALRAALG